MIQVCDEQQALINWLPKWQDVVADIHAIALPSQNNTLCNGKTDSSIECRGGMHMPDSDYTHMTDCSIQRLFTTGEKPLQ